MFKKSKLIILAGITTSLILTNTFSCFADNSVVSKTQDNITLTKSAKWTTYNGQSTDSEGNPYVKIDFKLDTTNASTEVTNTVTQNADVDVVLVLDTSFTMTEKNKIEEATNAALNFIQSVNSINPNARLSLITFNDKAEVKFDFMSFSDANSKASSILAQIYDYGQTNYKDALTKAKTTLARSTKTNKVLVFLSDGIPFVGVNNQPENEYLPIADEIKASGTKIITVGYDTASSEAEMISVLKKISSEDENHNKMFYKAEITSSAISNDLKTVFKEISQTITTYVTGNILTDTIPAEFKVIEDTLSCNDSSITTTLINDQKTISWDWKTNKLEKKIYEMSLITVLDKSKVPTGCDEINTNGTTIDITVDSSQSSCFSYNETNKIYLNSPRLTLKTSVKNNTSTLNSETNYNTPANSVKNDETPATNDSFNNSVYIIFALCGTAAIITGVITFRKRNYSL